MSLKKKEREAAKQYLIEQISRNRPDAVSHTADTFGISPAAVYRYLKELREQGVISGERRRYRLLTLKDKEFHYALSSQISEEDIVFGDLMPFFDGVADNVLEIWRYALSEMLNNVLEHAKASDCTVRIWQNYMDTTVLIRDNGIGIFRNIMDFYHFSSPDIAIEELFKGKLTTNAEAHSGEGIFFTSRIMDLFAAISERNCFTQNKYDQIISQFKEPLETDGTTVFMRLSNFSHKVLRELFDEYADVNGGFTKTKIPLKNIFETCPVSRSQAKRLYQRFDCFEEVILDFSEVTDIGQGFAHELFTVFSKAHPGVTLTPVNVNEAVKRMIYHVTH
ncbi:MAG: DUF4325 domain-containing protein [Lachnospiraceae bacterium]|nr:DUF4325 domain-containing protein [Lachnospiraceae bacterium]